MACGTLTKGRGLDCNRTAGGIKAVFFGVYDEFDDPISTTGIVQSAGEITDIQMGGNDLYRYILPLGTATVSEAITGSTENGSIFYAPTVTIMLNGLSKEDQNQIKLLAATKVVIFAQLNAQLSGKDVIIGLGVTNGMNLNSGTIDSGAAFGDRNGYSLTFTGMEPLPFATVAPYTTEPFDNYAGLIMEHYRNFIVSLVSSFSIFLIFLREGWFLATLFFFKLIKNKVKQINNQLFYYIVGKRNMIQAITGTNLTAYLQTEDNRINTSVAKSKIRHLFKFTNDMDKSIVYAYASSEVIENRYTEFDFLYDATPDIYTGLIDLKPAGYWKYEVYEVSWTGTVTISSGFAPATETDVLSPSASNKGIVQGSSD
jgi:hypothetical protein